MNEQADAYKSLDETATQLSDALVRSDIASIESLTREGETSLTKMRSKLLEIMSSLTQFAETRQPEGSILDKGVKEEFERCAKELIEKAREFKQTADKAASLAVGGSSFAAACIQECGVPPTTYSKPVLKRIANNG